MPAVLRFSSGLPVTLFNNNDTSLLGTIPNAINNNGVDTPNYTLGNLNLQLNPRGGESAFNTALVQSSCSWTARNGGPAVLLRPGHGNIDMALEKNAMLSETKSLEFRLEAFNALNHAQFYGPAAVNGNIGSASFGRSAASRAVMVKLSF